LLINLIFFPVIDMNYNKLPPLLKILLLLILLIGLFTIGRYSSFYDIGLSKQSTIPKRTHKSLQPNVDVLDPPIIDRELTFQDHLARQAELRQLSKNCLSYG